ncbi:FecR family protein [Fulvivirga lutea]|uniref:FecR domain-containing protein n=1 Tax=Fulvivirga lutea TaxID=2810512 RepID=A0A974WKX0_9BACT|nr:FecR domain-containing protein [Fulvivirga lutea]QSE98060.1 FecR domain-containing protein [Fulvivirga lutea]
MSEDKNHIEILIAKVITGQSTYDERIAVEDWCKESAENQQVFDHYKKLYAIDKGHFTVPDLAIDVDSEWELFRSKVSGAKTIEMTPKSSANWLKVAAAILLIFASTFIIYKYLFSDSLIIHQTADAKQEYVLPDKSIVTLNANSSISYTSEFGSTTRAIELKGEAFFEVERNEKLPFIISAGDARVTVLGTSFNVSTTSSATEVVVSTGLVALSSQSTDKKIELGVGDAGKLSSQGELIQYKNEDTNFNSWKTGLIVFESTSLKKAIEDLNKVYKSSISISDEVTATCEVTATFDNQPLDSVLKVLTSTLDLTIEQTGQDIEITKAGC